jgi:hypothetical protein
MGFTTDDAMVRVDFFKPRGKWYTTEAVKWTGEWAGPSLIYREFAKSLRDHFAERETQPGLQHANHRVETRRLSGMIAVCLEPYHEHAHPLMMQVDDIDARVVDA